MKKYLLCLVLMVGLLAACVAELDPLQSSRMENLARGAEEVEILAFGEMLFRQVLENGEANAVISPLSVYYALNMVALGAEGNTLAEFLQVLFADPLYQAAELARITQLLTGTSGNTTVNIAGSVWLHHLYTIDEDFNTAMIRYFGAPAHSRDFLDHATVAEVNAWVYQNTEGLIPEIIEGFDPLDVMLLVNALYFKAKWPTSWGPLTVSQQDFTPQNGQLVTVDFLTSYRTGSFDLAVTDRYEAVLMPYDCGQFGFLLVRPTDGTNIRDFFNEFYGISTLRQQFTRRNAIVSMPRLDLEYEITLNNVLQAIGLVDAFCGDAANFSGLINEDVNDLHISEVLHKVRLIVGEEGTEAAAVTSIRVSAMSGIYPPPIRLTFDTPYIYAIICLETNIPLFIGVVDNPGIQNPA